MTRSIHLLIVDPQNDFCDLPDAYRPTDPLTGSPVEPALPIAGAHADMQRLARFIDATAHALSSITVTLDSHHRLDIAHPTFWRMGNGDPVPPFTPITAAQLRAGEFVPRHDDDVPRTLNYLNELEARGRYTLMAWPVHCEIGTWGHNVHADVRAAYGRWEEDRQFIVRKVPKGANPWTEHYSALMAEVPDADDPYAAVATLRDATVPGSVLALSHLTLDGLPTLPTEQGTAIYRRSSSPLVPRTRDQVARFLDGYELVEPGLVKVADWRPDGEPQAAVSHGYGGVGVRR